MLRKITVLLLVMCFSPVWASSGDVHSSMRQIKKAFVDAAQSSSVEEMKSAMGRLDEIVTDLKQGEYQGDRGKIMQEGFQKLSVAVKQVESELDQGNLQGAKEKLRTIDSLRSEYHSKVR
ncbi:Cytochrome b562 [Vibrio ruber DSM 16370]|uniref:Cytochrome b562 n=1 Tax=Vibrio ruber (strain DSM 16370 / JCM 11486 / BCRC 17186 / CECT 7878 / LMG 23124 / VR1) TaxID=1123498 RepID=A0A1R4LGJ3_VIBR1|nr:cytochrome b562 [Vibrio ruber]SJN55563.1 Cytochrome b562 [Vibrio ruber DSM 16370]